MLYREAGQFKTTYSADMAMLPIRQDRIALIAFLAFAFIGVPLLRSGRSAAPTCCAPSSFRS